MAWADAAGVTLRYARSGPAAAPVVVLMHELGGSLDTWLPVAALLEPAHHVVAFDQRGAGQSEKVRQPFAFDRHADDVLALLDALGLSGAVDVGGVASGAAIALLLAARHPERVRRLVLCAPALAVTAERRTYLAERSARAARDGMRAVAGETLDRSYPLEVRDPIVFDEYRSRFICNDPIGYGFANMAFAANDVEGLVAGVGQRSLLLAGVHDGLRPPHAVRALAARMKDARLELVEAGHVMPLQAPRQVAAHMLTFLTP
jgi:3-oxoadipate enol-lactonase